MSKLSALLVALGVVIAIPAAQAMSAEPVQVMKTAKGRVFANPTGMTLYVFDKDTKGVSNCSGLCALAWPALMAPADAKVRRRWSVVAHGGAMQWAYRGRPLYTFAKDVKPGDVTGDGVEGTWHVAKP